MVFLDVETSNHAEGVREKKYIKMAWLCYVERRPPPRHNTEIWQYVETGLDLCDFLWKRALPDKPLYVFGHNIFFDLQSSDFFYNFSRFGWELDFYHDRGMSYALFIRRERRSLKIVSTTNFFGFPLEKIGQMVGLPKGRVDFDTVDDVALSAYCRRDVEIIKKAMQEYFEFIQVHDLGKFSITKASQAMSAFRHRFMNRKIYIHDHLGAQFLEKEAYFGGRTEAFYIGQVPGGPFASLDVNSMYPYVMREKPLPVKLINYHERLSVTAVADKIKKYGMIAECLLSVDKPIYAVRLDQKVCFPTGKIIATLCTGGIQRALEEGHLKRVRRASIYEMDVLFTDFVDYLHTLKEQYDRSENKIYRALIRLVLNSLYGKFAQYVPIQKTYEEFSDKPYYREEYLDIDTGQREMVYKMFNTLVIEEGREIGKNSFVAVSAHITEYARLVLWDIIKPMYPGKVFYVDTDSLKIRSADLDQVRWFKDPQKLGALKTESIREQLEIRGAKSYVTEKERVIKGVPKSAVEIRPHTFEFLSFPGQTSHMRKRIDRYFEAVKMTRYCPPSYDKGIVHPTGWVEPFHLQQW
jgi:hypothetical protein